VFSVPDCIGEYQRNIDRMRDAEHRINRLNQEALELRTRLDPNNEVNSMALPGQQVVQNNFGVNR
jgi:hypothetical protein